MTTTTKTDRITITLVQEFNGALAGFGMRTHALRTLRGLKSVIADYYRAHGWTLTLAAQDRAALLAWVATQLGGHEGDARRWLAERRVGGID